MNYLGDFAEDSVIDFPFTSSDGSGGTVAPSSAFEAADLVIYKDNSATQKTSANGVSIQSPFDVTVGLHHARIDTSIDTGDAGFWVTGSDYIVVLVPDETVDNQTVVSVVAHFSIENRLDRIGVAGASLTDLGGMSTAMIAEVQAAAEAALVAKSLDHLISASVTGADVADNSIIALLMSASGTADFDDFVNSTDSLVAIAAAIGGLSTGSAAINIEAESYVLTTGTQSSGTFADTATVNGVYHEHTDTGGVMDLYYQFNLGGNSIGSLVTINARINGGNDDVTVYAWNWGASGWDEIGELVGTNGTDDTLLTPILLKRHTGTGANIGLARVRFAAASGLSSATLRVDRIAAALSVVSESVGYDGGQVWIDTVNGGAGTIAFTNGTADNPVLTLADALSIASTVGLSRFFVINGSTITLAESHINETWEGKNWTLALGGQDIGGSIFGGANVSGIATGTKPKFEGGEIGNVTLPPCRINGKAGFTGTLTVGSAGDFDIIACTSLIPGAPTPMIDLVGAVGATRFNIRGWLGGLEFANIGVSDEISLEGEGGVVTIDGTGGNIHVRGIFENVIDNSSALVTVTQIATLNRRSLAGYEDNSVWIDTSGTNSGTIPYVDGTSDNPVNNIADATTLAGSVGTDGVRAFSLVRGASITLAQTYTNYKFGGSGGIIALNGQDIAFCIFQNMDVSGIGVGSGRTIWDTCGIRNVSINQAITINCAVEGMINLTEVGDYSFIDSYPDDISSLPIFNFGAAVGSVNLQLIDYQGDVELQNMGQLGTDVCVITGAGTITINANCTGGTLSVAGNFDIIDNAGGAVTITDDARYNINQIQQADLAFVNGTAIIGDGSDSANEFRSTLEP